MMKWISIEGNFGSGKTSLLKFIQVERPNHLAFPDTSDFNTKRHVHGIENLDKQFVSLYVQNPIAENRFLYPVKRMMMFLLIREQNSGALSKSGIMFTDGSSLSFLPFISPVFEVPETYPSENIPDLMVFLNLPSLEDNMQRRLNVRYSISDLTKRQFYLDSLISKYPEKSIKIDITPDDLPETIYAKVKKEITDFFKLKVQSPAAPKPEPGESTDQAEVNKSSDITNDYAEPELNTATPCCNNNVGRDIGPDEKYLHSCGGGGGGSCASPACSVFFNT